MQTPGNPEVFLRAVEVFETAKKREISQFGPRRLEAQTSGEIDWTISEISERLRECAAESESDPEVLDWVEQLIEEHWERVLHVTALYQLGSG